MIILDWCGLLHASTDWTLLCGFYIECDWMRNYMEVTKDWFSTVFNQLSDRLCWITHCWRSATFYSGSISWPRLVLHKLQSRGMRRGGAAQLRCITWCHSVCIILCACLLRSADFSTSPGFFFLRDDLVDGVFCGWRNFSAVLGLSVARFRPVFNFVILPFETRLLTSEAH